MASKRSTVYGSSSTAASISDSVITGPTNASSGTGAISQHGSVGVSAQSAPATAPPRYQPPPQVPGILKQVVQTARPGVTVPHGVNKAQRRPNPIVGGPSTTQLQPFADDDLIRLLHGVPVNINASSSDVHKSSRKPENEGTRMTTDVNQAARESARLQSLASELRTMREVNQRLSDDNQELRDLCCFLDDDRQKGRKLAREWQRFGRYTASVMRQEVSAYQSKLRQLDARQHELVRDNLELKELCLYLDEERNQVGVCPNCGNGGDGVIRPPPAHRDDGDGSSSSTNADEPSSTNAGMRLHEDQRIGLTDEMMQYVRSLEQRVKTLEEEKRVLEQKLAMQGGPDNVFGVDSPMWDANDSSSRPEAVVQALQVLEVREQVENGTPTAGNFSRGGPPAMDDGERALVREMCNVVWRKLEESPVCNTTGPLARRAHSMIRISTLVRSRISVQSVVTSLSNSQTVCKRHSFLRLVSRFNDVPSPKVKPFRRIVGAVS